MNTDTASTGAIVGDNPGILGRFENLAVTLTLAAMVLLPLAESLLRSTLGIGISAAPILVQHLTLIIGMLGAAIGRPPIPSALTFNSSFAKRTLEGWSAPYRQLLRSRYQRFLRRSQLPIPVDRDRSRQQSGLRNSCLDLSACTPSGICRHRHTAVLASCLYPSGTGCRGPNRRLGDLSRRSATGLSGRYGPARPYSSAGGDNSRRSHSSSLWAAAAMILFWGEGVPIAALPVDHYRLATNPTLPTIPLFTLAGYFLAEGGASKRLIRVFGCMFGQIRGGPAVVTALVCAFFTSFTGASGVTILALGGLLMPILLAERYSEKNSLGLLTGAGSLGLLFPPCLPLILYAIVARITIEEMFLGGILPGILLVGLTAWWGISRGPKRTTSDSKAFKPREAARAAWEAKWELLLPLVALGAMFGGFATPVEAAALTAFYAFVIETFIYGDLKIFKDSPRVMTECGLLVGGVLLILGVALGFTNYLIDVQIPTRALEWGHRHCAVQVTSSCCC